MKKTLIALAALAATGAVMAQSSVTIYGVIDQSVTRTSNSGGTSNTELRNGGNLTNRLGFRGTEDLGGGLKAKFQIEMNLFADNPSNPPSNVTANLGDRGAWVALASDSMGELRLGREYNNAFWNPILFSAWGTNGVGQTIIHTARNGLMNTGVSGFGAGQTNYIWNNNTINYILPSTLGGVYGSFQYAFDEEPAPGVNVGQSTNMRVGFKDGALDVAFGYAKTDGINTGAKDDVTSTNLGASYDFGVVKLMATWSQDKVKDTATGTTVGKLTGYEIGALAPVGPGKVRASYGQVKLGDTGLAADPKASKFAVGYIYPLSKRTSVYTSYARTSNKNNATISTIGVTGPAANRSSSGIDFGISHTF